MNIDFDTKGYPVTIITSKALITTETMPAVSSKTPVDTLSVGAFKYYGWGDGDKFPDYATNMTEDKTGNPVLARTLSMLVDILCGQGLVPVRITGVDANTKQNTYEIVTELLPLLRKSWVRNYITEAFRDLKKMGNAFVQFRPSMDGTKITKLHIVNARAVRLAYMPNEPYPKSILVGSFPEPKAETTTAYNLLDQYDPDEDLILKVATKKVFFQHIKENFSNASFYKSPSWITAATWLDISNKLPKSINSGIDNILNIAFHIKIPYSYWAKKYPEDAYPVRAIRMELIKNDLKQLEDNLTSVEKARRAMITHFGDRPDSPNADKVEIEVVKVDFPINILSNATAADSYVAIAAGGHPDILGLIFGNSKGGSMQREILLLLYALSWSARQAIAEPLEMMVKFNEPKYEDVEFMFRQTFLTTLDTGGGTGNVLS